MNLSLLLTEIADKLVQKTIQSRIIGSISQFPSPNSALA
jgi:hypothetical protein